MELRQLRYFVAVADERHFTRAARTQFVSQPALSQQIQALEREVGAPLFDRLGRHVELTAAGRVLLEHARRVLREVENARAALEDVRGGVRGDLTIATIQTANVGFLVDVIARFHQTHPGVMVRVREERSDAVASVLRAGGAQLGLAYVPLEDAEDLCWTELYTEELVLVVPADDPRAATSMATGQVADVPLIVPPGGYCLRQGVNDVLSEAGARQNVVAEIAAIEGICAAVRSRMGCAILPARYVIPRAQREGLGVVRLIDPTPRRRVGFVASTQRYVCTATAAFTAELMQAGDTADLRIA